MTVLALLKMLKQKYPNMRYGQIIDNAISGDVGKTPKDLFYIEDEELFELLQRYLNSR